MPGFNLTDDLSGPSNRYDETHAIFSAELVDNLHMTSLTKGIGSETYDSTQSAGSGPIDCIYVAGHQAGDFTIAKKSSQTFGSDHFAVTTRFLFSGSAPPSSGGGGGGMASTIRILGLLPNPAGPDPGNEQIRLRNQSTQSVDLDGRTLTDEGNTTFSLGGTVAAGAERVITLPAGAMPLNNGGDEIELKNDSGEVVPVVNYTSGQVTQGIEIIVQ